MTGMMLADVRAALADAVRPTGLPVALEPRGAHVPCLLVGPLVRVVPTTVCSAAVEVPLWLVTRAPGDAAAVDWLVAQLAAVWSALAVAGAEVLSAELGSLDVGQGDLPVFEITTTMEVTL